MKYLDEYRNEHLVRHYLEKIAGLVSHPWTIMEICGGQTHSLVKNGILDLLPEQVTMVHGPGCPVCVTPVGIIDEAIRLAERADVILCSFGDMLRVPGSEKNLLEVKAQGGNVRILYSPLEAVSMARENPKLKVVFFAVGFETTAPANALAVLQAAAQNVSNFSLLTSHVLVPPAMEAILSDEENVIDGFLAAGHVCTVMGYEEYLPISRKYQVPIVVTGFEPVDLLHGIFLAVQQLENQEYKVENQYTRVVTRSGNQKAQDVIQKVFQVSEREWRGIGPIPESGYEIRPDYKDFDAREVFQLGKIQGLENKECIAGEILKGIKKPPACPNFGTKCTPSSPLGAPMVSSEGACAAYYHYAGPTVSNT